MKAKLIAAVFNEETYYLIKNGPFYLKEVDIITQEITWTRCEGYAWSYPDKDIAQDFLDVIINKEAV